MKDKKKKGEEFSPNLRLPKQTKKSPWRESRLVTPLETGESDINGEVQRRIGKSAVIGILTLQRICWGRNKEGLNLRTSSGYLGGEVRKQK